MSKYTQWITHKGKRMLLVNGPGLSEAQYIEAMEEMKQEILKEKDGALVLVNVSGIEMTKAVINKSKEVVNATKEAGIPDTTKCRGGPERAAEGGGATVRTWRALRGHG